MRAALYLRYCRWESRGSGGRLLYFVLCLAIGVAAVVAVSSLSRSLEQGVRSEAKKLLAGDLAISSRRPLPSELDSLLAAAAGSRRADTRELVTIVAGERSGGAGRSQLVELKAVEGPYPLYGELELEPSLPLAQLFADDGVVVAPELLVRLELAVGQTLLIGGQAFTITGVVHAEPDRVADLFSLGPRVLLGAAGLERAGLVQMGSRVRYRALVRLPAGSTLRDLERLAEELRSNLPGAEYLRIETYTEAQPRIRRSVRRMEGYLGLVALLSLLVGGVGAAQAVRAWMSSRLDAIAILKCLGLRPRELVLLFLAQAGLLGVGGSLLGGAAGLSVPMLLPRVLGDLLPGDLIQPWQPWALLRGLALGVGAALVFSLPPLLAVLRVPASRVLRRDAGPLPGSRLVAATTVVGIILAVAGLAMLQSRSLELAAQFTGGVLATAAALAGAALLVTRGSARLPREFGRFWLRHGFAALARPGAATMGAIVALGLGLLVFLALEQVEGQLSEQLSADLPQQAPSAFLIDIQPDQWPDVERLLEEEGAVHVDSVPVVMARLDRVDDTPIRHLVRDDADRGRRWALTREQRLTYLDQLPADNEILEGGLWSHADEPEVSLEADFARQLGVGVGSRVRFDVQGVPLDFLVSSLRRVDWESFGINFYVVVEPGVLDGAPQSRLAAARLPREQEQAIQDRLAAEHPNVTLLRLHQVLARVVAILERLGWAVRFLGGFTLVAALAILAGAIATSSLRRGREVALLKTLGLTRAGVVAAFASEYALVGLVAGLIGGLGGTLLAWLVLTYGMEIPFRLEPLALVRVAAIGTLISVVAGLAASLPALKRRPIEVLRRE